MGGDPWRPWGDTSTKTPQKEAWVPQDPTTSPTNSKGSHCLDGTLLRAPPPPVAPVCLASSRACSTAAPKVWVQHGPVTSGRLLYQPLRWAGAWTGATPPTLEPVHPPPGFWLGRLTACVREARTAGL